MMVMLYDYESGALLACMEAGRMGQIRTGAASGLATRYMARQDAATVAVIGSGFQARTQLEAVCAVREIKQARVFSRRQERREEFASRSGERLGVDVKAVESAQECVEGADIVITITSARGPGGPGRVACAGGAYQRSRGQPLDAAGGWRRRQCSAPR